MSNGIGAAFRSGPALPVMPGDDVQLKALVSEAAGIFFQPGPRLLVEHRRLRRNIAHQEGRRIILRTGRPVFRRAEMAAVEAGTYVGGVHSPEEAFGQLIVA